MTEKKAEEGHAGLEQAEDQTDAEPRAGIDPGHADSDGGGEARQAEGQGDQQQHKHPTTPIDIRANIAIWR
nr:hypothetical protein [Streptacidiphilus jiangxiensis]